MEPLRLRPNMLIYRLKKLLQRIIPLSLSRADKRSAQLSISKVGPTQTFFQPTAANPGNLFAQDYMHQRPVAPDEFRGVALPERGERSCKGSLVQAVFHLHRLECFAIIWP